MTTNGQVIKPADTAKLLGVISDKEMRWKDHVQQGQHRARWPQTPSAGTNTAALPSMCDTSARLCIDYLA